MRRANKRWPRLAAVLLLLLALSVAVAAPLRHYVLRQTGRLLVLEDPIATAEVAVLMTEAGRAGELEVADLVHAGQVRRVLVMAPPKGAIDREFARRGIRDENGAAQSVRLIVLLGVDPSNVDVLEVEQGGTGGESRALVRWCRERGVGSLVVVSNRHHSRRLRRTLLRLVADDNLRISVRAARYDSFDPSDWWLDRDTLRIGIVELQKLMLDYVAHPF